MVRLQNVLISLEKFEEHMSRLYAKFEQVFANDVEAASLFAKMGRAEKSHRDIVQFEMRMARNLAGKNPEVDINLQEIEQGREQIENLLKSSRSPSLKEAVELAIELENDIAELLYKDIFQKVDPKLADLVNSMLKEEEEHRQDLASFARRRGIAW